MEPHNRSSNVDPQKIATLQPAPSYSFFLREHLQKNKPCLLSPDLVMSWPAFTHWVVDHDVDGPPGGVVDSQPNWDYFRERYGDQFVSVAQCSSRDSSDQRREQRSLREVIDLWKSGNGQGLYVKDWHLAKSVREKGDRSFYEIPDIFRDDWMNAFWEQEGKDDFRFVYMGVTGTFTPLHRDVYTSYSWSTNITGTKIWYLFPPAVSHHLRRHPSRTSSEIVYDIRDVDEGIFKEFEMARREMMVVEQHSGWTIFVPSGWYHQVLNVTDTVSINHNWCNINNLPSMYSALLAAVSDVESALSDVRDLLCTRSGNPDWGREWVEVVQDVLRKDSGWELSDFSSWILFWRMVHMNLGQLKDPPLHPNPVWPLTPPALRPSFTETKPVVERLLDNFTRTRSGDIVFIKNLPSVLDNLRFILSP